VAAALTAGDLHIGRLRHRGDGDPLWLRLRYEAVMAWAAVRPAGFSPSAILVVRRLHDPRPRSLQLSGDGLPGSANWSHSLADRLARVAGTAHRPAAGTAPSTSEAVVFRDRAELLGCLVRDWLGGELAGRWWWDHLAPRIDRQSVVSLLLESPQALPPITQAAARDGKAIALARVFEPEEATRLAAALGVVFAVPAFGRASASLGSSSRASGVGARDRPGDSRADRPSPWLIAATEALELPAEPERALLLGAALTLARGPAVARSPTFERRLLFWAESARQEHGGRALQAPADSPAQRQRSSALPHPGLERPVLQWHSGPSQRDGPLSSLLAPPHAGRDGSPAMSQASQPLGPAAQPAAADRGVQGSVSPGPAPTSTEPGVMRRQPSAGEVLPPTESQVALETQLGGIFYLLNFALAVGHYGDFTQPRRAGIHLDPWQYLARLARALRAGRPDDALWPLLDRLAQIGGAPRRRGFMAPRDWRVPPEWLTPFATSPGAWSLWVGEGRLQVSHRAGFVILDVAAHAAAGHADALEVVSAYGQARLRRVGKPMVVGGRSRTERWFNLLAAYARARLALALGLREPRRLPQILFAATARVHVTSTAVDVEFPLSELPLQVRLAGLDRDPGWLPAAGRSIRFHFD
jgi:hypothetical protein